MIVLAVIREMLVQEEIQTNDEGQAYFLLAKKYKVKEKDIRDFKRIAWIRGGQQWELIYL